jgi:hypothetical protein
MPCKEDYLPGTPKREIAIRRRVHRIAEFYRHAMVYVIVTGLLWLFNAFQIYKSTQPGFNVFLIYDALQQAKWYSWWAIWSTLGWGIGVIAHGITALPAWELFSEEWEDKKTREIMEREQQ